LELKAPGFPHWHLISLDHKLLETRNEKGSKGDQNEVTTSDAICVGAEPESPLFQPKFVVEAVQSQKTASILADREQTSPVFQPFSSKIRNQSMTN